jgi:hypothetical protein
MSRRYLSRRRKFTVGLILFIVISGATLWVTSWALEPEPFGAPLAPDPAAYQGAIIQVYGADVWGFRGNFAIHTWIATKSHGAAEYQIYQVIGWRLRRGRSVVSVASGNPARPWYGSPAILLHEIGGAEAAALIDQVHDAALSYPFEREYRMWPGPNSNSFTAWIGLEVPELRLELPLKAIGQSWMRSEYPALRD